MAFTPVRLTAPCPKIRPFSRCESSSFFFRLVPLPNMASADFPFRLRFGISRGKPVLLPQEPAGFTLLLTVANRASRYIARLPHSLCLLPDSCSSGPCFASGFLQIPPYDGHPCLRLTVPCHQGPFGTLTLKVADMHGTQSSRRKGR